jgi:hypothetical protein
MGAPWKERFAMDGTYGIVFGGVAGVGMGFFVVRDGTLTGAGIAGGRFQGCVTPDPATGALHIVFDHFVPAGLRLVQGTSPHDLDMTKQLTVDLPADFGDGEPIKLHLPPGPVTVMIKRIPDSYAALAHGVAIVPALPDRG